ncbi:tyrosine-type recombinase/integrase [Marinigracilibium pacificum]|uniref:Tyrosine-type recombinase/integrase n=1 Tax=Marinigracilibium pacificum TaxID=2729599 RepID=A0A848J1Y5_9BACT|nr:tyrosine-type recombinase/integrase [Marinigracilibium pacificum]NMM49806.1 tyrosine-type recombinase/integrase [Marinigracilibium pacificum]
MLKSFLNYILHQKRYSGNTVEAYQRDLSQYQSFLRNTFDLDDETKADYNQIRSWVVSLMESEVEPTTINRKLASVKAYYKYLLKHEIIDSNPALRVKSLKKPSRLPQFILEEDIIDLLDTIRPQEELLNDFYSWRDYIVFSLLYTTGMRRAELIGLKEDDINFFSSRIKVLGKRNKERVIPVPKYIIDDIKFYIELKKLHFDNNDTTYLIVNKSGGQSYPMLVQKTIKKLLDDNKTKVNKRSPHVLRHSYATHLLSNGADINSVKELLGHSGLAATQVYTHRSIKELKRVFEQAHPKA